MKSKSTYFITNDGGVTFAIYANRNYDIFSGTDKFEIASGRGIFECAFDKKQDAIDWIKNELKTLNV